jgi:hypothetical protein
MTCWSLARLLLAYMYPSPKRVQPNPSYYMSRRTQTLGARIHGRNTTWDTDAHAPQFPTSNEVPNTTTTTIPITYTSRQ